MQASKKKKITQTNDNVLDELKQLVRNCADNEQISNYNLAIRAANSSISPCK